MEELPSTIGVYRVERLLGQGGMGAVYAAVHPSIERRVAIKVLHPEFAVRPEFVGRFFNEARAVNRVDHPGLVQISDYGQLPGGTAYIVMEYLRGESLSARMKGQGVLRIRDTLRLSFLIADALVAAHEKGIVHRDLKPDNVMIVADPNIEGGERTKLLDFGIAKLSEGGDGVKTKTDAVMGTPLYMSPEQCKGAGGVDDRSDVYALGVMLFHMLAGQPPFSGAGFGEIIAKHMFQPPPSLSSLAPDVPSAVVALVNRLLQKDRNLRPKMREVATELQALAKKVPDKPRPAEVLARRAQAEALAHTPLDPPSLSTGTSGSRGGGRVWQAAAGLLLVAGLGLGLFRGLSHKPDAAGTPAAASARLAPVTLPWSIHSEPAGAKVVWSDDGSELCQTPCQLQRPAQAGMVRLRLHLPGYQDRTLQVDGARPVQRHEILDAVPAAATTPATPTARARSGEKSATDAQNSPAGSRSRGSRSSSSTSTSTSTPAPAASPRPTERTNDRPKIED